LSKKHRNGQIPKLDWLDRLSFCEIEAICEKEKRESDFMFLNIEFPIAEYAGVQYGIAYYEKNAEVLDSTDGELPTLGETKWLPDHEILLVQESAQGRGPVLRLEEMGPKPSTSSTWKNKCKVFWSKCFRKSLRNLWNWILKRVRNFEMKFPRWKWNFKCSNVNNEYGNPISNTIFLKDNIVENKHHALSRCTRTGLSDVDLKPNASMRDQLNAIVNYPPTKPLSANEQDLIWTYRYYLSSNKKALAKFLKCVKWDIAGEKKQALELLNKWAPMDVQDALELLGPQFTQTEVRIYAVARLRKAPDEDLLLYLLQLVQALKYEDEGKIRDGLHHSMSILSSYNLESQIRWISSPRWNSSSRKYFCKRGRGVLPPATQGSVNPVEKKSDGLLLNTTNPDLATFLIHRACENSTLVNYFYWYLLIECEDQDVGVKQDKQIREMYKTVMKRFLTCLKRGKPEWQQRRAVLSRQQKFITKLVDVVKAVAKENANRQKKMERLQSILSDESTLKMNFLQFDALPFPLDPEVYITGILAKEATLFKSSQMPCKLTFHTESDEPYIAIFKHGDDLRQDQLILQIITLMDKLLRKENLDLNLTPYRVLSTSTTHGFVQYIPSMTVADVLAQEGTIQNFFKKHHPADSDAYNEVMDTYVKSCAGYCVITYLLGVGDRHLDNLLLTPSGKLFHIDFGYILGRDPKPMPPPMKLSKEMVEAMGGIQSEYYQEFRKLCYTAFLHLRRHANLILNLFSLMVGASVPDIALEPDKTVKKVLDKFKLELNDEAAVKYMQELIDISVSAFMPALVEQLHKFTQMLRK
ncbi:unnamed protein product, partial [Allacma fusca]